MIDRLGAELPVITRSVGSFSGGQQQSVAIARALTFDPKIVIMDEPTAALAVREVRSVLELIRQLKPQGIGVILISHRLNDVLSVTDRIVVLRQGRATAGEGRREQDAPRARGALPGEQHRPTWVDRDRVLQPSPSALAKGQRKSSDSGSRSWY